MIKEILFRAAERTKIQTIFVSNQSLQLPPSLFIKRVQVSYGFDVADNKIAQSVESGDLVVTADIPLADLVIAREGIALNPRGELYSKDNIKQRLSIRNFNEQLRGGGVDIGGPAKLTQRDSHAFAKQLDQLLCRVSI
jgi:uncharacterized protein YaiI (UPF0178 family)